MKDENTKRKKYKEIELRSEEVQEVMNHIPAWILRWGITILFFIIMILLAGSYLFKYPDTIEAGITVSSQTPPAYILAKTAGRVDSLYSVHNNYVLQGEILGIIENPARPKDIFQVKRQLELWEASEYTLNEAEKLLFERYLQLGEVQASYATFITTLNDYYNFVKQNYYPQKIENSKKQLKNQEASLQLAQKQYQLGKEEQEAINRIYKRDSILYKKNAMIAAEYDQSQRDYLQSLQSRESSSMSLNQITTQLIQSRGNILDIQRQASIEEQKHIVDLKNAIEQLHVQLISWEQHYLLVAPISGKITFMSIWSNNQNVMAGETVFVIAPLAESHPVGKALLPLQRSGKVKVGQQVNIRLDNYPDQEFGYVKGKVVNISPVPTADATYVVEVELPKGLRTNYNKDLPMSREMKGSAEIITEDMRLIERLLSPLRKLKNNGK